jgi:hypothetical protein
VRAHAPVQPAWRLALPPTASGTWYVCGARPVPETFAPTPWCLLARGLADRAAAKEWVRANYRRLEDLRHFAVDCNEPVRAGVIEWEVFERARDGELHSSRDGRRL